MAKDKKSQPQAETTEVEVKDLETVEVEISETPTPEPDFANVSESHLLEQLKAQLQESTILIENLRSENEALRGEVDEYSELMELSDKQFAELEVKLANVGADEAKIREQLTSEMVSQEIQDAIRYKNEVIAKADEDAKIIISTARAEAAELHRTIVEDATNLAKKQHELARAAKAEYEETIERLEVLMKNLGQTVKSKVELSIPVVVKESKPTAGVPAQPSPESIPVNQTPPAPNGDKPSWPTAKPSSSTRGNAAAERLRARLGK